MKIRRIVPWLVRSDMSYWGEYLFVEVRTDEDITGWGEITTTTRVANRSLGAMVHQLNELLVGHDPALIEQTWHKVFRAFTYMGSRGAAANVTSAIDIALWDIRGKVLSRPVYDLLGGPVREDLALYTHPDQSRFVSEDGVREEVARVVASGHTAIKFDPFPHPPGVSPDNDGYLDGNLDGTLEGRAMELTALIHDAAGPDIELLVDAHARFNVPTAIRLAHRLAETARIHWFEEPVPPESYHALSQVRQRVPVPISVGERLHTRWDFVPVLEGQLADFIMPDVTWTGGISELKKIATMAEAYYIPISPHDAAGPINVVAGGHVMLTVPNFYRIESSGVDLAGYNDMLDLPLDNAGGRLRLAPRPGLGIELNLDYLQTNRTATFG